MWREVKIFLLSFKENTFNGKMSHNMHDYNEENAFLSVIYITFHISFWAFFCVNGP